MAKRLDWTKRFSELSVVEKSMFYDNVRKATFGYIYKRAGDDELAYELINDAYMKAIEKAKEDVTIRSLRSYIGTVAWNALYHRQVKEKNNPIVLYDPTYMPDVSLDEIFDEEEPKHGLPAYVIKNIQSLNPTEKQRLSDVARVENNTKELCRLWGMEAGQVRSAVSRLRQKIKRREPI